MTEETGSHSKRARSVWVLAMVNVVISAIALIVQELDITILADV